VTQIQTEPLDLQAISPTFEQGLETEPFVMRFYVWSEQTGAHRGEVLAYDRRHHGFTTEVPEGPLMVKRVRELAPQKHAISVFEEMIDGRPTYFQAQLRFKSPSRDQLTSFVALRVDANQLREEFIPASSPAT
jgi:hypothetical protein